MACTYSQNVQAAALKHADYISTDTLSVTFTDPMDAVDVLEPAMYHIQGPGSANRFGIPPATVQPVPTRPHTYILTWDQGYFVHGTTLTLTINSDPISGLKDAGGALIDDPTSAAVFLMPGQWQYVWGPDDYTDPIDPQIYIEPDYTGPEPFPGGREHAASWVDPISGRMWMFGGRVTDDHNDNRGELNDFWNFRQSGTSNTTGTWELTSGTATYFDKGNYPETHGDTAFPDAYPGARHSAVTWVDDDNNFWMFGGFSTDGFDSLIYNDLWKFELDSTRTNGTWVWMGGLDSAVYDNSSGVYPPNHGEEGVPPARLNAMSWVDSDGVLWLFGGTEADINSGHFNDLWKYEIDSTGLTTGTWTFVSGDEGAIIDTPLYPADHGMTGGRPSAREGAATYVDNQGNLWLFGGERKNPDTAVPEVLNDLWKYDPVTGDWTWMAGSSEGDYLGAFEMSHREEGIPAARTNPGFWVDDGGRFYLLGGVSVRPDLDNPGNVEEWYSNDMWRYVPDASGETTGTWTWVAGPNFLSNDGIYPLPDSNKGYPWATSGPVVWVDNEGDFWLFGGESSNSGAVEPFTSSIFWTWDGMFGGGVPICVSGSSYVSRNTITLTYTGPMGGGVDNPLNYVLQGTGAGSRVGSHPNTVTQMPGSFIYVLQWNDAEFVIGGNLSVTINTDDIVDAWGNGICVSPTNNLVVPPHNPACVCPPLP